MSTAIDAAETGRLPVATGGQTARAAWQALRGRRALLGVGLFSSAVGAAASLVTPAVLGRVVDDVSDGRTEVSVWTYGGVIAAASIVMAVASAVGIVVASRVLERLLADLRERLVHTALRLPQQRVERSGTGDLLSRASDDVAQVSEALSQVLPTFAATVFTIVLTAAGLTVLDWRYGVAVVATAPAYALALRWYLRTAPELYAAERACTGTRAHHLLSALKGRDTVLAYRLSDRHNHRIAAASWGVARWSLRARTVQTMFFGRLDAAFGACLAIVVAIGFWLVDSGAGTLGTATTAVLLFLRLSGPIRQLMIVTDILQSATSSLARIVGITEIDVARPTDTRPGQPVPGHPLARDVVLEGVEFGYEPDRPVLHGVNLTVGDGERVAVVGASGAGKTTLAALVAGVHPPGSGRVDRPADTMLLSQETHVFAGTLRDNLTLAAPDASDRDVVAALTDVDAGDLLDLLPDGLDSEIGSAGHDLTSAQAQHVALARVALASPDLVILDEATAEAGSAHAGVLDRAADAVLADRTGLVVAHRLSQARVCDRIVVMADGAITESGTHEQLVAAGGVYARLWSAWDMPSQPNRPERSTP
ncbi:ABC transporter ATP-binding protein [Gordonia sp. MP11Mi]|uniref:Multidrug export ATP-binding/permease protein n=1 Tax=Gordonia sp. MP11Mi TaxID=3022769 RepID=A0AA97CW10_9ACTN